MKRTSRLVLIEEMITTNVVTTQEQLLSLMEGEGIKCTQATLSRDLRQMGISRNFDGRGGYRYLLQGKAGRRTEILPGQETGSVTGMTWARGMLIINTPPGFAAAVAIKIDMAGLYEIAGTVAGDDTILLIPRDDISNDAIEECLRTIFKTNK